MKLIYHIPSTSAWESAQVTGSVMADSLTTEGFIHCSREAQLLAVANRFFAGSNSILVLAIDEAQVVQWLVNEGPAGTSDPFAADVFPHVYAPIPVSAIVGEFEFVAGADGRFDWPRESSAQ